MSTPYTYLIGWSELDLWYYGVLVEKLILLWKIFNVNMEWMRWK
jgi:hypothetical protein